jgi:hypothetical protein
MIPAIGRFIPAWQLLMLAVVAACFGVTAGRPAHAEDSGFWDVIHSMSRRSSSFAPARAWFPGSSFRRAAPKTRAEPQVVRLPEQPAVPLKPADPAKRANPLVTLLADPTLRKGDIVVFPEGPRVFVGRPGTQHAMTDFVAVSRDKDMAKSTRNALAALPIGENNAWSSTAAVARGQLAQGAPDVETTGALPGKGAAR